MVKKNSYSIFRCANQPCTSVVWLFLQQPCNSGQYYWLRWRETYLKPSSEFLAEVGFELGTCCSASHTSILNWHGPLPTSGSAEFRSSISRSTLGPLAGEVNLHTKQNYSSGSGCAQEKCPAAAWVGIKKDLQENFGMRKDTCFQPNVFIEMVFMCKIEAVSNNKVGLLFFNTSSNVSE